MLRSGILSEEDKVFQEDRQHEVSNLNMPPGPEL